MSPNSHPGKVGSVVESITIYNVIVRSWITTEDIKSTSSGLESVRVMIRTVLLRCNSEAGRHIYFFELHNAQGRARLVLLRW